jgi:hypothetical protein
MARIESSVEGTIQSVEADASGAGVIIQAIGVTIRFLPGSTSSGRTKTIKTPTNTLTPAQLRDKTKFRGRVEEGFVGGTVIAEGFYDTDLGLLDADFLQVEPGETVLLGALTENLPGPPRSLKINKAPVVMLNDPRLSSNPENPAVPVFLNQYALPMKIDSAAIVTPTPDPNPTLVPTSAEGYFAGGVFHAFLFEYGGTGILAADPRTTPQISMIRAQYRDRGAQFEVDARGFLTTAHAPPGSPPQSVEVYRVDIDPTTGKRVETPLDRATIDAREPGFERWRLVVRRNKSGPFQGIPTAIVVKNHSGIVPASGTQPAHPATAELEPDVREE